MVSFNPKIQKNDSEQIVQNNSLNVSTPTQKLTIKMTEIVQITEKEKQEMLLLGLDPNKQEDLNIYKSMHTKGLTLCVVKQL